MAEKSRLSLIIQIRAEMARIRELVKRNAVSEEQLADMMDKIRDICRKPSIN